MQVVEGDMETDDQQPEVPFSKRFAQHAPGGFRETVIDAGEELKGRLT